MKTGVGTQFSLILAKIEFRPRFGLRDVFRLVYINFAMGDFLNIVALQQVIAGQWGYRGEKYRPVQVYKLGRGKYR